MYECMYWVRAGPADLGFLLSESWEEENLGMYVQMAQPELHCQGLSVRLAV